MKAVYQSPVVTLDELKRGLVTTKEPVRITYLTKEQYKRATKSLGLMDDFKVKAFITSTEKGLHRFSRFFRVVSHALLIAV